MLFCFDLFALCLFCLLLVYFGGLSVICFGALSVVLGCLVCGYLIGDFVGVFRMFELAWLWMILFKIGYWVLLICFGLVGFCLVLAI